MLQAVFLVVKRLGGIHVAAVLRDKVRLFHIGDDRLLGLTAGLFAVVYKVVVGVNVL